MPFSCAAACCTGNQSNAEFGYFSAVCFFFGRRVSEALSPVGDVPVGLIDSSWGGTNIECWSPFVDPNPASTQKWHGQGGCYNGMISPFTTGPLPIKGVAWYQVTSAAFTVPPSATT